MSGRTWRCDGAPVVTSKLTSPVARIAVANGEPQLVGRMISASTGPFAEGRRVGY